MPLEDIAFELSRLSIDARNTTRKSAESLTLHILEGTQ